MTIDLADHESVEFLFGKKYDDSIRALAALISEGNIQIADTSGSSVRLVMADK